MPFDHARCPHCQTNIDPERLLQGTKGPLCPKCQMPLSMKDLFGVADAFAEAEDDGNSLTLDDLVPGGGSGRPASHDDDGDLTLDSLLGQRRSPSPKAPARIPGPTAPKKR
jgi:hypothetical protein